VNSAEVVTGVERVATLTSPELVTEILTSLRVVRSNVEQGVQTLEHAREGRGEAGVDLVAVGPEGVATRGGKCVDLEERVVGRHRLVARVRVPLERVQPRAVTAVPVDAAVAGHTKQKSALASLTLVCGTRRIHVNLVALGRVLLGEVVNVKPRLGRLSGQLELSAICAFKCPCHAEKSHLAELLAKDLHVLSRQVLSKEEGNAAFGD
jgi:hypothetical protein